MEKFSQYEGPLDFYENEALNLTGIDIEFHDDKPMLEFYKNKKKISTVDISKKHLYDIHVELEERGFRFIYDYEEEMGTAHFSTTEYHSQAFTYNWAS
jgi:hypothetical protein